MMAYWPWWLGAIALASLTVGFWVLVGRPLGVSGSWARLIAWRESREMDKVAQAFSDNPEVMEDALMAATLAEFGEKTAKSSLGGASRAAHTAEAGALAPPARVPWSVHLTFLLSMAVGGFLASVWNQDWGLYFDLGATHKQLFGSGWLTSMALLLGGGMVGFGTQMAGGCTSGHGLSGCSRLAPSSLAATMAFFGAAVGVSYFVEMVAL
ncbi:MAG TPA: hypothetical protein VGA00_06500 [Acidiferrobacterales bacterium]